MKRRYAIFQKKKKSLETEALKEHSSPPGRENCGIVCWLIIEQDE